MASSSRALLRLYSCCGFPPALRALRFSSSESTHPISTFKSILSEADVQKYLRYKCKSANISLVEAHFLFNSLLSMKNPPLMSSFGLLFNALIKNKHYHHVISLILELDLRYCDYICFNVLLNCLCKMGRSMYGFVVLGMIFRCGYNVNVVTFNTLINGLWKEFRVNKATSLFKNMKQFGCNPDVITYDIMIDGLCKEGFTKQAKGIFINMLDSGIEPNIVTYNSLIYGFCSCDRWDDTRTFISKMINHKTLQPDVETLNMILHRLHKDGKIDEAWELLALMIENGFPPNVLTYSSIINALCEEGRWADSSKLHSIMEKQGCAPNVVTYNVILNHLCKHEHVLKAMELLGLMVEKGINPDTQTYNILIHGFCLVGRMNDARGLFISMIDKGCKHDVYSYSIMIDGYCKNDRLEEAEGLYTEMISKGVMLDAATYNTILVAYFQAGMAEKVKEIFGIMRLNGVMPDEYTYNILFDGFCNKSWVAEALEVLTVLIKGCYHLNILSFCSIINGLRKIGGFHIACKMFHHRSQKGMPLDVISYNIIIHGLCEEGRLEEAINMLRTMEVEIWAPKPDVVTYNTLMQAQLGKRRKVKKLFYSMIERNIMPDRVTASIMAKLNRRDRIFLID